MMRQLDLLVIQDGAKHFRFKSSRAGRATSMAQEGHPLSEILAWGEWKSAAVLRYLNTGMLDPGNFLATTMDESDSEWRSIIDLFFFLCGKELQS